MTARLKLLLRVCAVGSSLLLVAAFVAYRAGALGWLIQAESIAVAASPAPETESEDGSLPEKPTEKPPVILGGSKSVVFDDLLPAPTDEPRPPWPRATATESPEDEIILGGSKSGILISSKPKKPARPARPTPTPASSE